MLNVASGKLRLGVPEKKQDVSRPIHYSHRSKWHKTTLPTGTAQKC
jgi:hypothetical protein